MTTEIKYVSGERSFNEGVSGCSIGETIIITIEDSMIEISKDDVDTITLYSDNWKTQIFHWQNYEILK